MLLGNPMRFWGLLRPSVTPPLGHQALRDRIDLYLPVPPLCPPFSGVRVPPLPETMHYPYAGWWWLHLFAATSLFCWGWYVGQNRAERRFLKMQDQRDKGQE